MIRDRNIDPEGLSAAAIDLLLPLAIGNPAISDVSGIVTLSGTTTPTGTISAAVGQPAAYRNLRYSMTAATTAAFSDASGTVRAEGFDIGGSSILETLALSSLMEAGTIQGTVVFKSIGSSGIHVVGAGITETGAASSQTANTVSVGNAQHIGMPSYVNLAAQVRSIQLDGAEITAFTLSTNLATNLEKGGVPQAAIDVGAGPTTAKPLVVWYELKP